MTRILWVFNTIYSVDKRTRRPSPVIFYRLQITPCDSERWVSDRLIGHFLLISIYSGNFLSLLCAHIVLKTGYHKSIKKGRPTCQSSLRPNTPYDDWNFRLKEMETVISVVFFHVLGHMIYEIVSHHSVSWTKLKDKSVIGFHSLRADSASSCLQFPLII